MLKSKAPLEPTHLPPIVVVVVAHQDDEFGAYGVIERHVRSGHNVRCFYLSDGRWGGGPERRNAESLAVLERLGVPREHVHFFELTDTILYRQLDMAFDLVRERIEHLQGTVSTIYMPAWEGGNEDHDATHLVGQALARHFGVNQAWQVPLYQGKGLPWRFFRIMTPLPENGPVCGCRVALRDRLRYLRYVWLYRSQVLMWMVFFPGFALHQLFVRAQPLQALSPLRCQERPHSGTLLYERIGRCRYEQFAEAARQFILRRIVRAPAS
jgi:N-acetylglucosamine malate deacetylase 1